MRLRDARRLGTTVVAMLMTVALPTIALAATPAPSQPGVGDPRSSGQGPGLVGDPLMALVIVIAIAALSAIVTLAYVRATADRNGARPR